eukprot:1983454-Pyramimonas_sp.AAC.1
MAARPAPRVVAPPVRQELAVPVRGCRAVSKVWQTCMCQVSASGQASSRRSSSCNSDIPEGSLPYHTTCNV